MYILVPQNRFHTSSTNFSDPFSANDQLQPLSAFVYKVLLPASRLSKSTFPLAPNTEVWLSKRLLSSSPRYVVLASTAKKTIVYIGCMVADFVHAANTGRNCLFSHDGVLCCCSTPFSAGRHRAGIKDAPSMISDFLARRRVERYLFCIAIYGFPQS
jgi:hypothetical protein